MNQTSPDRMPNPRLAPGVAVIVKLVVLGQLLGSPMAAQTSGCLAPDDTSARIVHFVSVLLTDTSQAGVAERDTVGLTGVTPSQVSAVTDSRTCAKFVSTLNHFEGVNNPNRKVYAYSVGSSNYVVQDPNLHSGEWTPVFLLDRTFKIIRPYLAF